PRTISVICDNALVTAFAQDERPVSRSTVLEVCRDFDLLPEGAGDRDQSAPRLAEAKTTRPTAAFDPVSTAAFDPKPQAAADSRQDGEPGKPRLEARSRPQLASGDYFSVYGTRKRFSFFRAVS